MTLRSVADWRAGTLGQTEVTMVSFGRQDLADLDAAARREWLVADGLGGYAVGTMPGLRTRRYHGPLVVATRPPGERMLGLAALDPVLTAGLHRARLAVHGCRARRAPGSGEGRDRPVRQLGRERAEVDHRAGAVRQG